MQTLEQKFEALKQNINSLGSLGVAFSGGVDSTLLLKVAHDLLGERAIALTAALRSVPEFELREARTFCAAEGIRHIIQDVNELEVPAFSENGPERCYYCKVNVLEHLGAVAREAGFLNIVEGSNTDDLGDYRPGRRAVLEFGVKSPLLEAGLSKAEVRELSARLGLKTWDKPAYACLASRVPSGEIITEEKLRQVEAAEDFLMSKGFRQLRVRVHGDLARIELPPEQIAALAAPELREELVAHFQSLGFRYVSLDLAGYKTGNMNPKNASASKL